MKIVDLTEEHKDLFSMCLEDWSDDAKEGGAKRREWVTRSQKKGLRAKLALDDKGQVGGMIQYLPIEQSFVDGRDLYFIACIWVHGHKQGRGNFQKKGMGKELLAAAEEDIRSLGAKGIAAWGVWLPFWMKASWFKKQGFKKADRQGLAVLLWKPFAEDAQKPEWLKQTKKRPELTPGKVTVAAFLSGWCMVKNLVYERAKRAAEEFGDSVVFREIDTSDRKVLADWGISDEVFIDHQKAQRGPPPSYEKIKRMIEKRVQKLRVV
jgi:N-acetylglutamate synthase-like GNAT family acetyltransferase